MIYLAFGYWLFYWRETDNNNNNYNYNCSLEQLNTTNI